MSARALNPEDLYHPCDPDRLGFSVTSEVTEDGVAFGQAEALDAARFGIEMGRPGYNIFAIGSASRDTHAAMMPVLEGAASQRPAAGDWCYVHNFQLPSKPKALSFPAGEGERFRRALNQLVEDLKASIPAAFESEEYQARRQLLEQKFQDRQEKAFTEIQEKAKESGVAMFSTPHGFTFAPVRDGAVIKPDVFAKLPQQEQEEIERRVSELQQALREQIQQIPIWQREARDELKQLNRETTLAAVKPLFEEIRRQFDACRSALDHVEAMQEDVLDNADDFLKEESEATNLVSGALFGGEDKFTRYQVNVLVSNESDGAPVVYADNPAYANLFGRLEHRARFGALTTDFTLIKAGALHRANGGYLIVDARKILTQPFAWEALKRVLQSRELRIESIEQMLSVMTTVSLEPEPVPIDLKVVMIGERRLYYLLSAYDPDFADFFKVLVDFNDEIDRDADRDRLYARSLAALAQDKKLRPFSATAIARVIDQSSRLAGDSTKLSAQISAMEDLLEEAELFGLQAGHEVVQAEDVEQAITAQHRRHDRPRRKIQEHILRETLMIDTQGERVGQVNGLSVLDLGTYAFGRPSRITATVRLGSGKVVDIEREVELGGPLHSKGVMILSSFLGARYAANFPLAFSASLVFEQSYGGVEGDSASSAELFALLSALAQIPIRQCYAVTGSVNQFGEIQAIGGVNEKIEGFFEICQARGLTGSQGVLIPEANVPNLMLHRDVVDAVRAGQFHIHTVTTVDAAMAILTGVDAGQAGVDGEFPPDTINARVSDRLRDLAEKARGFAHHGEDDGAE
ncbi:MAG: ATP-binding protein [Pseudomonadota bacterium]|nr:ATP-binding protein [Pseudomonadota bacterium]